MSEDSGAISGIRLRLGVFLILLFWLPIWLLAPAIADLLGYPPNSTGAHNVFITIALIQTALGVIGALITGKTIFLLLKKVPRKQVPKVFWQALKTGKTDGFDN